MTRSLGIYIHIPFCRKKCNYCGFLSFPIESDAELKKQTSAYIDVLEDEILNFKKSWSEASGLSPEEGTYAVDSVFFGGGTPSLLSAEQIARILGDIAGVFELDDPEVTLEANPESLLKSDLEALINAGINRLSIGMQSSCDDILLELGRIHSYDVFAKSYEAARKAGFKNINIDAMFGLPGQELSIFSETLEKLIEHDPEHISLYSLQLEEGTKFYEEYKNENFNMPSYELDREMYHTALKRLADNGYEHYEISNFAKPGYKSWHNEKYWTMDDFVGFGLSASSYFNGIRYSNMVNLSDYIDAIEAGELPVLSNSELSIESEEDAMSVFSFTGLRRREGISFEAFQKKFGRDFRDVYRHVKDDIARYRQRGLLNMTEYSLSLTDNGIDVSNEIMSCFILDNGKGGMNL